MIKSMTGYGKANLAQENREYQVEIKSVNHRYLDISVKMPRVLSYLEEAVKKEIAKKVKRGKIDIFITFENHSTQGKEIKINTEIAKLYIKELKNLAKQEDLLSNIEVIDVAKFPDVLTIQNNEEDETIKEELITVVGQATQKLTQMRSIEGSKIAQDLNTRITAIYGKIKEILLPKAIRKIEDQAFSKAGDNCKIIEV